MKSNAKMIKCPRCKQDIQQYDGRSTTIIIRKCPKCKRFVKFEPLKNAITIFDNTLRTDSGGMRFY